MLHELIFYKTPDGAQRIEVVFREENFWMTQRALADLFGVKVPAISKHLKNIFDSGELMEEEVVSILENTTQHGAIEGKTQTLKEYVIKGFGIVAAASRRSSLSRNQRRDASAILPSDLQRVIKMIAAAFSEKLATQP